MATKTVTIDTTDASVKGSEMVYIDRNGGRHTITNGQSFVLTLTDNSATDVRYSVNAAQTMTTMDGYTLKFRRRVSGDNKVHEMTFRDAFQNGTAEYAAPGEMAIECPITGIIQYWRVAIADINDVDAPTAIARLLLEDQFGNRMDLPTDDAGTITVA